MSKAAGIGTRCVHAGAAESGPVLPPIVQSTATRWESYQQPPTFSYAREGNVVVQRLEQRLADLEEGADAVCFATGIAAIDALVRCFPAGARVVVGQHVYGGTTRLLNQVHEGRFELITVDSSDNEAVSAALADGADLVIVETPTNPTLRITDLQHVIAEARNGGAFVAVDNTFLTPLGQLPIALGADASIQSTTKYIDGHNATLGGAVILAPEHVGPDQLSTKLRWTRTATGTTLAPFEAWLTLHGSKTLHLRFARQCDNATAVAGALQEADAEVHFPGLSDHPGHVAHRAQASRDGAIIAVDLGSLDAAATFVDALQIFTLAENLGATESLVSSPALMTHAGLAPERRAADGITDGLVRLSLGVEDEADLVADVLQALAATAPLTLPN